MALVSMKEMLIKAKDGKYAVGQFNINNLEWTQAVLEAAEELNSPVILGVSTGAAKYMGGFKTVVKMVNGLLEDYQISVPVSLHLDHGPSIEACKEALDAGFTSVMIDASQYSIDENIRITKEVVEYAKKTGASVEAEVGHVGGQEEDVVADIMYARPEDCVRIAKESGIDCLAPALGSVHGPYKGEPKLGFVEMEEVRDLTGIPLVLHGGSGIPDQQIQKAISLGTAKINVNTECQQAFTDTLRKALSEFPDVYDPRKYLTPAKKAIVGVVKEKMTLFGSTNQA